MVKNKMQMRFPSFRILTNMIVIMVLAVSRLVFAANLENKLIMENLLQVYTEESPPP
jgi:ABC-type Fe3+-siderophore transport system permease subunit